MKTAFALTVLILTVALYGCADQTPPTPAEVPGTYVGKYGGGKEVFDIRTDGSFKQLLTVGTTPLYTNSGTWRIRGQFVVFDGMCRQARGQTTAHNPGRKTDNVQGLWVIGDKGWRAISFDVDVGYQIERQAANRK